METQKTLIVIDSERDKQKKAQQEQTKVKEAKNPSSSLPHFYIWQETVSLTTSFFSLPPLSLPRALFNLCLHFVHFSLLTRSRNIRLN